MFVRPNECLDGPPGSLAVICHLFIRMNVLRVPTGVCLRDAIRDFGRLLFTAIFVFAHINKRYQQCFLLDTSSERLDWIRSNP